MNNLGRMLILLGVAIAVIGVVVMLMGRVPFLRDLPTLRVNLGENITCIFPIALSIILSIVLTVGLNILVRLLNR